MWGRALCDGEKLTWSCCVVSRSFATTQIVAPIVGRPMF